MSAVLAIQFLTFVLNSILGFVVLSRKPRSETHWYFWIFAMGVAGWNLALFLATSGLGQPLLWGRLAFSLASLMPMGLYLFSASFPWPDKNLNRERILLFILGFAFGAIPLTDLIVKNVKVIDHTYITGELAPAYFLYLLYYFGFLIAAFIKLFLKYLRSQGINKTQLAYVLLGTIIFLLPLFLTQLILPIFGIFKFNNLGPLFSLPMLIIISYAILRYRLMDIEVILRRGTTFSLLFIITAAVYNAAISGLSLYLPALYSRLTAVLIITLTFLPLKNLLETLTDKIFFRKAYRFEEAIQQLNHLLVRTTGLEPLLKKLLEYLTDTLKTEKVAVLLTEPNQERFITHLTIGSDNQVLTIDYQNPIIRYLEVKKPSIATHGREIIDRHELEYEIENSQFNDEEKQKREEAVATLKSLDFALAVPLFSTKEKLLGLILIGEKRSDDRFSNKDLQLLDTISHETVFSIENALNVERVLELDRAKSEFVSVVSHHLRSPISVAKWNMELLLEGSYGEIAGNRIKEAVNLIYREITKLNDGLSSLLLALEIAEGKVYLRLENFDFARTIITPVIDELSAALKQRKIKLTIDNNYPELMISSDIDKLKQVFRALLMNAVNYSDDNGAIKVLIAKGKDELLVSVEDEGMGISYETRQRIFEKFFRAEEARKKFTDGLGLGLFIAKALVEKHGGELWFETKTKGSRFTFSLPIKEN